MGRSLRHSIRTPVATTADLWTGMVFVELPPGRFTMGSASTEAGRNADETLHDVEITRPFLMGQREVTQQEWRTVMGSTVSHFSTCGPRCPVENVTFAEVQHSLFHECQLTSNGVTRGRSDHLERRRERIHELEAGVKDWRLLLQIGSDRNGPNWTWGDMGRLYFCIRDDDLAARRFEKSRCAEQFG